MILLKVQCHCGQKYSFDVTPVNDRVPFPVTCPICKADGNALANQALAQKLAELRAAPEIRLSGAPPSSTLEPLPAPLPPPRASGPTPARSSTARPVAAPQAVPKVRRGNDGWSTPETGLNKLGTQIVVTASIVAGLLAWEIGGVSVAPMILGIAVSICGIIGGILNVYGRGPLWAGAMIGLTIALGGYLAVEAWIRNRESVFFLEITLAFCVGTLPGFGLQFGLQKLLHSRL